MILGNRSFRMRPYRLACRNGERGNNAGQIGSYIGIGLGIAAAVIFAPEITLPTVALYASIGATLGGLAGTLYDTANAPDNRQTQQSLSDLKIQTSTYGQVIPQMIGQFGGIAGNVFWSTDKIEHQHTTSGGGGGGKGLGGGGGSQITTTKTYTVSMAIGICDTRLTGPVQIEKVWKDLTLMTDTSLGSSGGAGGYTVTDPGNGYAVGDTGGIGGGNFDMGYEVTAIGGGGAVVSVDLFAGSGYVIGTPYPLHRGGAQPGHGNEATITLTSIVGNGLPTGWTFYEGTADQLPDPTIEAELGVGDVPGYHYLAYVVIKDDDLGASGAVHNYTFQTRQVADHDIKDVIGLFCEASGIGSSHRDVSELPDADVNMALVSMQALRAPLQELAQDLRFYVVESGRRLKFRPMGAGELVFAISQEDMDTSEGTPQVRGLQAEHVDEVPLPTELDITYIDPAMNWQNNTQRTMLALQTGSLEAPRTLSTTVALSADQAKQLSQEAVYEAWIQRETLSAPVGRKWSRLEPGDRGVLVARGIRYGCVLSETTYGRPGIMELTALLDAGFVRGAPIPAPGTAHLPDWSTNVATRLPTTALLLNLPALTSSDVAPRYSVGYRSESSPWPGALLFRSSDGEQSYEEKDASAVRISTGLISGTIPSADWHVLDTTTVIIVVMDHGALMSITDIALYNGQNLCAIVDANGNTVEILAFAVATLTAPATYHLSRLLRGRRGTEYGVGIHGSGERLVMLDATIHRVSMSLDERNVAYPFKAVTAGFPVFSAEVQTFTPHASNLDGWSVAQPRAVLDGSDWTFSWYYRSRFAGDWVDSVGAGFDVDFNGFELRLYANDTYITVVAAYQTDGGNPMDPETHKHFLYTAAMQIDDFGSPQSELFYRIYSLTNAGISYAVNLDTA